MTNSIYYLPGHGGRLHAGLGAELLRRGHNVVGRETVGEFRAIPFSEKIAIIAEDLASGYWHADALVIANSFGAYLFLNALARLQPYVGKVLLLSPIVGEFSTVDDRVGFIPPHSGRLAELAKAGTYPVPLHCEMHVGEQDWQSNPIHVTKFAGLLDLTATIVPKAGHTLDRRCVSALLDRWLPRVETVTAKSP